MPRLIVHPDTPNAVEIPLQRGVTTMGRDNDNHHAFDDPSVSGNHFQLSVTNAGTIVRDLGSTNGTFVDDHRIDEAILLPGQTIRAGEVVMRFEADYGTEEARPAAAKPPSGGNAFCQTHPKNPARFLCPKCHLLLCEKCVTTRTARGQRKKLCLTCWVECIHLDPPAPTVVERKPFLPQIPGAFLYPLQGDGPFLLVGGAVFFGVMGLIAAFTFIWGLVLRFVLTGYLIVYAREILRNSADGDDRMPPWPDLERASEYLTPVLEFVGAGIVSFAPAIALRFFPNTPGYEPLLWTAVILGCIYYPIAVTGVTMFDSMGGVDPRLVIPSIFRIPLQSLLVSAVLAASFGLIVLIQWLIGNVLRIPILPALIGGILQIYFMAVAMRLCGLLYHAEEKKLAWF